MILIKGLNKYYNTGRSNQLHVLKNVTLTLPDKGLVAVFGRSGCGKTTLLNVVGGLDGYASGQVLIDGRQLKEDLDRTRNSDMGYVFQNYHLNYESNCFDNVADALRLCGIRERDVLERRCMTALRLVGMEKYALRMPDTLSGGQQQRIAIARAIVKGPKIILADEPTGNLDEANTLMIMDLLKELSKDRLVLLVTHEADLVDHYCDRVVEIKDGRIVSVKENKEANGLRA
ncbi:MAG: ABC transporter ATP-binding protein, partial [Clostridia bacterium]|nr:ABC transporter ATP-binding protein [Clostridia bacterium]